MCAQKKNQAISQHKVLEHKKHICIRSPIFKESIKQKLVEDSHNHIKEHKILTLLFLRKKRRKGKKRRLIIFSNNDELEVKITFNHSKNLTAI